MERGFKRVAVEDNYGLTSSVSLGVGSAYTTLGSSSSPSVSGLGDLQFMVKAHSEVSSDVRLYYGADLQWSPQNAKEDSNGDSTNLYSGKNSVAPYLGASMNVGGAHQLGFYFSQELALGKAKLEKPSSTEELSGDNVTQFRLFWDSEQSWGFLGATVDYQKQSNQVNETQNTTSEAMPLIGGSLYSRFDLPTYSIIPSVGYYTKTKSDLEGVTYSKYNIFTAGVDFRMTF